MVKSYPELSSKFGAVARVAAACCSLTTVVRHTVGMFGYMNSDKAKLLPLKTSRISPQVPCSRGTPQKLDAPV